MTNIVQVAPVTVTPVLYMADGTRYELAPITLEPAGVTQVDINQALLSAPGNVLNHISDFGSASIEYMWPWKGAVMATAENLDVPRSLVFHYPLQSPISKPAKNDNGNKNEKAKPGKITKEGLWWKHDDDVVGFVALSNVTASEIDAHLRVSSSDGKNSFEKDVKVGANSTQDIELSSFMSNTKKSSHEGGVTLTYKGTPADVVIVGGLENDAIGYSAKMTFATEPTTPTGDQFVASAVGIMVGAPDPMMMFPAGTTFTPYAALRNTSAKAVLVSPTAHYMNGSVPVTVRLRPFQLQPNESAQMNVQAELAAAGIHSLSGMLTLGFSSNAAATDLLLATGSVDQTGTYVFEVECKGSGPSEGKILGNWNTSDGNDTMISVWNSGDADQDLNAIIFYSGGQYKYPIHLAKNASTMFNISDIIMMQMPDADGNVIPAGIQQGSAVLANASGQSDPVNVGVSVGTFNAETATCGTKCPTCLGYSDFWISNAPFGVGIGSNYVVNALAQLQNGSQVNKNTSASWGSSNGSIGSSSGNGNFQGVSDGNFLANANISLISVDQDCPYNGAPCGTDPYAGSGQGTIDDFTIGGGPQSPVDGSQSAPFSAVVTSGTASAYQWSFSAPTGSGNSPSVNFTSQTSSQTQTDAHWFANPDSPCGAAASSTYTITAQVTFAHETLSKNTQLNVTLPALGGSTDFLAATVDGLPSMHDDGSGTWRVLDEGNLVRIVPTTYSVFVPSTSQFYNKISQHEQKHVAQFIQGLGLFGDLYLVDNAYTFYLEPLTGTSQADLTDKVLQAIAQFDEDQSGVVNTRRQQAEDQAFAISDALSPFYFYMGACRSF